MSLSIVTAVCGKNEVTKEWLDTTIARCAESHELIVVSNGSSSDEVEELSHWLDELRQYQGWATRLIKYTDPMGTTAAFEHGARVSRRSIVAMLHNDLEIKENNWDQKVMSFFDDTVVYRNLVFANQYHAGVCGFVGAKRLGASDIYQSPYQLQQLARFDVYSSQDDAELHGKKIDSPVRVAVLDGMALILRRSVFDEVRGFDLKYIHHMYDNDLCLKVMKAGYHNWVLPIEVHHRGGMTSCGSEYGQWARDNFRGDQEIHRQSHEHFYEKWNGLLPMGVE